MSADIIFLNRWRPPDPKKRKSPVAGRTFSGTRNQERPEVTVRRRLIQGRIGFAVEALDAQLGAVLLGFYRHRDAAQQVASERACVLALAVRP